MKYIRTKDKIITYEQGIEQAKKWFGTLFYNEEKGLEYLSQFKQADTIDELCDEAVFFDKDNVPHYKSKEGNIWYLGAGLFTESFRLGIFTDKGLIYVAKMNEEGQLCLL